jgi:catechol 2,3-dioxygenase-like lactoylglutathione lyase family enzyme
MHPLRLAPCCDEAGAAKKGEVTGNLGLRFVEDFDEEANAHLSVAHEVEEAKTRAVRQGGKDFFQLHEGIFHMRLDKYDSTAHILQSEYDEVIMTSTIEVLKPHISINVRNVGRSIDFYRRMLGIEPSKVRTGYAKFDIQNPPLNLALNEVPELPHAGALSHLGFQVASTDDVLAMRKRWADAGLITRDEMDTNCCYANQNKTWVRDPDGNEWEAFVVLRDNLPEQTATTSEACCAPASCGCSTNGATAETATCCAS